MTLIVSNCSKRKRGSLDPALHAAALAAGPAESVAAEWGERLESAIPTTLAKDLYAGRAFSDAVNAAAHLGARLAVVSAGLGLVDGSTLAPGYSLTTAPRDPDNVLAKTESSASEWWASLQSHSPFRSTSVDDEDGLILAALSSSYVDMIADEWSRWPEERRRRLRLFTKEPPKGAAESLRPAWMPYDDRLDSVGDGHAGTQGDFAQRALRHFATTIGDRGDLDQNRAAVGRSLHGLVAREVPIRVRRSDVEIQDLIIAEWDEVGGRSAAMLRHLRDTIGVACEQSRFKDLFNLVAAQRKREEAR